MSATPGSETLWLVHSGQNCGISRLASSTMSWNRRSSRFGAGSAMSVLLARDHVERVHEVAFVVRRAHDVLHEDAHQARVVIVGQYDDLVDVDPWLPLCDGFLHGIRHRAEEVGGHRLEHQLPD